MINRIVILICIPVLLCLAASGRQAHSELKNAAPSVKVLENTIQRILPGTPTAIYTDYRFVLVWKGKPMPASVFWRGQNGWLTCRVQKGHAGANHIYTPDAAMADMIHKGDTLIIIPVRGGKFSIPAEIPEGAVNTLYFKTAGAGWYYYTFNKITKKADVILP